MENPFKRGGGDKDSASSNKLVLTYQPDKSLSEAFEKLQKDTKRLVSKKRKEPKTDAQHRGKIALLFVWGYILIIAGIMIWIPIYNWFILRGVKVEVTNDQPVATIDSGQTLTQAGTLLGPPLGFVIGYYFKEKQNGKDK